jgi:negative regulator of flagellin synthesis FlgM
MKVNEYITGTSANPYAAETNEAAKDTKTKPQNGTTPIPEKTDKVRISDRSREIAHAQEVVKSTPEVRSDKVAELKAKIASGTYQVNASQVAEAMLKNSLTDKI